MVVSSSLPPPNISPGMLVSSHLRRVNGTFEAAEFEGVSLLSGGALENCGVEGGWVARLLEEERGDTWAFSSSGWLKGDP